MVIGARWSLNNVESFVKLKLSQPWQYFLNSDWKISNFNLKLNIKFQINFQQDLKASRLFISVNRFHPHFSSSFFWQTELKIWYFRTSNIFFRFQELVAFLFVSVLFLWWGNMKRMSLKLMMKFQSVCKFLEFIIHCWKKCPCLFYHIAIWPKYYNSFSLFISRVYSFSRINAHACFPLWAIWQEDV